MWVVSSIWGLRRKSRHSLNPLRLSHRHTLTQSCLVSLAKPPRVAYTAKYFVEETLIYKSGSVCVWGEENMTRKADEGIFKSKYHLTACESLPDLLLMPTQRLSLEGRARRFQGHTNGIRTRKPCALGFLMITDEKATLWKSN